MFHCYLNPKIHDTKSEKKRKNFIHTIKNGSVVAWQHINLQGTYDFSDDVLKDSIKFQLPDLLELKVA